MCVITSLTTIQSPKPVFCWMAQPQCYSAINMNFSAAIHTSVASTAHPSMSQTLFQCNQSHTLQLSIIYLHFNAIKPPFSTINMVISAELRYKTKHWNCALPVHKVKKKFSIVYWASKHLCIQTKEMCAFALKSLCGNQHHNDTTHVRCTWVTQSEVQTYHQAHKHTDIQSLCLFCLLCFGFFLTQALKFNKWNKQRCGAQICYHFSEYYKTKYTFPPPE